MNIHATNISRYSWITMAACVMAFAPSTATAEPAWHEQHRGEDLQVHYVRLTGQSIDSKSEHDSLQRAYSGCVDLHQKMGRPFEPLPPEGIPEIPSPMEDQIYYGQNRSLVVSKGKTHSIEVIGCALKAHPHHHIRLPVGIASCDIDLLTNTTTGICREHTRDEKRSTTGNPSHSLLIPMDDLNRVSPALRAEVLAWAEQTAARQPVASTKQPTGEQRHIAGYRCEVYATPNLVETCIAKPKSDFAFPIAPVNGYLPGLLLQGRAFGKKLDAQEVVLNMRVSKSLFEIPAGAKPRTSSGSKGRTR